MPYEHNVSDEFPPLHHTVWRYLDLAKFIDLLLRKEQWFNCVEEYSKDDPYEAA
jgi:hypothetical protein